MKRLVLYYYDGDSLLLEDTRTVKGSKLVIIRDLMRNYGPVRGASKGKYIFLTPDRIIVEVEIFEV